MFSAILLYCILTGLAFYHWCDSIDIKLFNSTDYLPDSNKIQIIGDTIEPYFDLLEEELAKSPYLNDGEEHSITDGHIHTLGNFYNPFSFAIWVNLQTSLHNIFTKYLPISILSGSLSSKK